MSSGHHTAQAHHHPGHSHPPAQAGMSLLRFSAAQRLTLAAGFSAVIWLAVFWAMR